MTDGIGVIKDREMARHIAARCGYFWMPCAVCGDEYAGFEWGESLIVEWGRGSGTCGKFACRVETRRRNREWLAANTPAPEGQQWLADRYESDNAPFPQE